MKLRPGDQPIPHGCGPEVLPVLDRAARRAWWRVWQRQSTGGAAIEIAELARERTRVGVERYGTPLRAHNGRDVLRDFREEVVDAAQYGVQAVMEGCRADELVRWLRAAAAIIEEAARQRRTPVVSIRKRIYRFIGSTQQKLGPLELSLSLVRGTGNVVLDIADRFAVAVNVLLPCRGWTSSGVGERCEPDGWVRTEVQVNVRWRKP